MAKKRGLGRGLAALLESDPPPARSTPVASSTAPPSPARLPVEALVPNRLQPRTEFAEDVLDSLAASIGAQGVVQPVVVTPLDGAAGSARYGIIAGERRWRAAQRAGLEEVPVVVRQVSGDRELLELALVENLQRSDLNPVEEAEAYRALQGRFGLSQDDIARRVGKGRTTVTNALRLLRLPAEVQELLREGSLSAGQARPLLALEDPERLLDLAREAAGGGLSAREVERRVRGGDTPKAKKKKAAEKAVEVHAAAAAETLTRHLQARVEIHRRGKGGRLVVHFHTEEELMRLYDDLMDIPKGGAS